VSKQDYDIIDAVDADLLWSAACTAYRINDGYLKVPQKEGNKIVKPTNREIVAIAMYDPSMITDADREAAQACRKYMANSVTMNALKGDLSEWGKITARICQLDTITSQYDLSVITAMPQSEFKARQRDTIDSRLAQCIPGSVGHVGDRVELEAEIVRNAYSSKFNTWYVTAITRGNFQIHFAYRESVASGTQAKISGTVKRHNDRSTQLNRVKLVNQEVV
jgi:hypothetical protein